MSDVRMPVKVWLPPSVYQALYKAATIRGFVDVGSFLAWQAEQACRPKLKRYNRVTDQLSEQMHLLRAQRVSNQDIADRLGVGVVTVWRHIGKQPW